MPRLDVWLVENGHFPSRQMAKRAIRAGHVTVNEHVAKPSTNVTGAESIIISDLSDIQPAGYSKIKDIETRIGHRLATPGIYALDIGCSVGGFLRFLLENGVKVIGIEVSTEFLDILQDLVDDYSELSLIIGDAFTIDINDICGKATLDLLLLDVTTEPNGTFKLVEKYTPLLKTGGRLVAAFKIKSTTDKAEKLGQVIAQLGYDNIIPIILDKTRHEVHIIATSK